MPRPMVVLDPATWDLYLAHAFSFFVTYLWRKKRVLLAMTRPLDRPRMSSIECLPIWTVAGGHGFETLNMCSLDSPSCTTCFFSYVEK